MVHRNFYAKIKELHKDIVTEIAVLMAKHCVSEIDLAGSSVDHAFIIGVPDFDWDIDYIEGEVCKVILEDGEVKLDVNWCIDTDEYLERYGDENGDIGELYQVIGADDFEKIVPCGGINNVYESVWQYLDNMTKANQIKLEKQVKAFERKCHYGDIIKLLYDKECISQYTFIEWTLDSKTPMNWMQEVVAFDIMMNGKDINKVEVVTEYKPR